jgi:triphosphoribosyl-dephospho-CoA synthetase
MSLSKRQHELENPLQYAPLVSSMQIVDDDREGFEAAVEAEMDRIYREEGELHVEGERYAFWYDAELQRRTVAERNVRERAQSNKRVSV